MFDYIVIGAGSAGCVLANRLSVDPAVKVLLIEAGSRDWNPMIHIPGGVGKLFGSGVNWRFHTAPQKHLDNRRIWFPQGKTLGGSSSINAMIYIRGQKEDYDQWAKMGCDGWSYQDVLPYFKRSEDNVRLANEFHGQGGPLIVSDQQSPHRLTQAFIRAAQTYGLPYNDDFNGTSQQGTGLYQITCYRGRRRSAAVSYLRPIKARKNLQVITGARVLRIVIEKNRAVGIEIVQGGNKKIISCSKEVVLSAGAINSPRLLMLSGIGDADELKSIGIAPLHNLPGVGKNLHDHLCSNLTVSLKQPISYDNHDKLPWSALHGLQYLLYRSGPAVSVIAEGGGFLTSDGGNRPDIQFHIIPAMVVRGGQTRLKGNGFTVNTTFLRPKSRGSVTLRSNDPRDEPIINPNYHDHPDDQALSIKSIKIAREILSQPDIAKFIKTERLPGFDAKTDKDIHAYIRQYACSDYHPVGTCKMGVDDMAVVDPQLQVKGIDGLRIADASIMPVLLSGNTNAPSIMIGEKAADFITQN